MNNLFVVLLEKLFSDLKDKYPKFATFMFGTIVASFFFLLIHIYERIVVISSKPNKKLSTKLKQITGEDIDAFVLDDKNVNAFTFGNKKIFILSGLMKLCTEEEVIAVSLHEIGHVKQYQGKSPVVTSALSGASVTSMFEAFWYAKQNKLSGIKLLGLVGGTAIGVNSILASLSRIKEYAADSYATKNGYGKELISALYKLHIHYKQAVKNPCLIQKGYTRYFCRFIHFFSGLMKSHPWVWDRVKEINKELKNNPTFREKIKNDNNVVSITNTILENKNIGTDDEMIKSKTLSLVSKINQIRKYGVLGKS